MSDDTLDIDELDDIEADPEPELDDEKPKGKKPKAKKPKGEGEAGLLSRIGGAISAPFAGISWGDIVSAKTGLIAVIVFLVVWLLLVNVSPVRIVLWFWPVDIPKAAAFIFDVALGAVLMWLLLRARAKAAEGKEEGK